VLIQQGDGVLACVICSFVRPLPRSTTVTTGPQDRVGFQAFRNADDCPLNFVEEMELVMLLVGAFVHAETPAVLFLGKFLKVYGQVLPRPDQR